MSNALLLIVSLLSTFLRTLKDHDDCPDGVCEPLLTKADGLKSKIAQPSVGFGIFDWIKLANCVPAGRIMAVVKQVGAILAECKLCPDGDCSFFDLLSCVDLEKVVEVVKEILSIVEDSRFCIDGDREITLGEAAA